MYCSKCGKAIPDNANFCGNCGNQVTSASASSSFNNTANINSKKKGIVVSIVSVWLCLGVIFILVLSFPSEFFKKESEGLEFELSSNAEYYIVIGFGECTDTEVIIPAKHKSKPVGAIGNKAFKGSERKSIVLPDGIIHIGDYAFSECINLSKVNLPEGLLTIGDHAFDECRSLLKLDLPDSLTSIGDSAFRACVKLKSVTIPENVVAIKESAFSSCVALESVTLPNEIPEFEGHIFNKCKALKKVYFPEGIERIDGAMCCDCESLEEVYIPESVTYISGAAFRGCNNLDTVYYSGSSSQFNSISFWMYLYGDFDWLSRVDIICGYDRLDLPVD